MKRYKHFFCFLITISFLGSSCEPENNDGPYLYNGVSYNRQTGLNENKTALYDDRNHAIYTVALIDSIYWMAENLRYEPSEGSSLNPNNPSEQYGRLYNWSSANSVCPQGWHLPSDDEWKELEIYLGMQASILSITGWRAVPQIERIKSTQGWAVGNGDNGLGLNIFPAGRNESGNFFGLGDYAYFWTSTVTDPSNSMARYFYRNYNEIYRNYISNAHHLSCRCVLD